MKQMQLAELGPLAEDIRNGETIELRDGDCIVGHIVRATQARLERANEADLERPNQAGLEARIQQLARDGVVRLGSGKPLPESFFTDPLPKLDSGSVLEQLLSDRSSRDY